MNSKPEVHAISIRDRDMLIGAIVAWHNSSQGTDDEVLVSELWMRVLGRIALYGLSSHYEGVEEVLADMGGKR